MPDPYEALRETAKAVLGPGVLPVGADPFALNQVVAQWLADDQRRATFLQAAAKARVLALPSAAPEVLDTDAPRYTLASAGHRTAWLVAGCDEVERVLDDGATFSSVPYADLGGRGFMLAFDKVATAPQVPDSHQDYARQRDYVDNLLRAYGKSFDRLAAVAFEQTATARLGADGFDLASVAHDAAVRACLLWFGFSARDFTPLSLAARAGYRGLVNVILGRHIGSDPVVLPEAQKAMAMLAKRAAELIVAYDERARYPDEVPGRMPHREERRFLPDGVESLDVWGLSGLGEPILPAMARAPGAFTVAELATMVVGLIVGTVGNVQASVCLAVRAALSDAAHGERYRNNPKAFVAQVLRDEPPVPFLPRRVLVNTDLAGCPLRAGDDVIVWVAARGSRTACPHAEGSMAFGGKARYCLGAAAGASLVDAIVAGVMALPSVAEALDPLKGTPKGLDRIAGFECKSYPLTHRRVRRLAQQPLNVVMRVKSPIDAHAAALQQVIAVGAPRIERALRESGHVHFAWFQFLDQQRYLALHTVYDGDFGAYVEHFALKVDDLFDQLFEHIEGGPPLPVRENPGAFVNTIRAFNAPFVGNYFFSAYPDRECADIQRGKGA